MLSHWSCCTLLKVCLQTCQVMPPSAAARKQCGFQHPYCGAGQSIMLSDAEMQLVGSVMTDRRCLTTLSWHPTCDTGTTRTTSCLNHEQHHRHARTIALMRSVDRLFASECLRCGLQRPRFCHGPAASASLGAAKCHQSAFDSRRADSAPRDHDRPGRSAARQTSRHNGRGRHTCKAVPPSRQRSSVPLNGVQESVGQDGSSTERRADARGEAYLAWWDRLTRRYVLASTVLFAASFVLAAGSAPPPANTVNQSIAAWTVRPQLPTPVRRHNRADTSRRPAPSLPHSMMPRREIAHGRLTRVAHSLLQKSKERNNLLFPAGNLPSTRGCIFRSAVGSQTLVASRCCRGRYSPRSRSRCWSRCGSAAARRKRRCCTPSGRLAIYGRCCRCVPVVCYVTTD